MKKYSIKEMSQILNVPVPTLRYYDKLGLVVAKRKENNYRYYDDADLMLFKYLEVMKYANFSLKEIEVLIKRKLDLNLDYKCLPETIEFVDKKYDQICLKIQQLELVSSILLKVKDLMVDCSDANPEEIDDLVTKIFERIGE